MIRELGYDAGPPVLTELGSTEEIHDDSGVGSPDAQALTATYDNRAVVDPEPLPELPEVVDVDTAEATIDHGDQTVDHGSMEGPATGEHREASTFVLFGSLSPATVEVLERTDTVPAADLGSLVVSETAASGEERPTEPGQSDVPAEPLVIPTEPVVTEALLVTEDDATREPAVAGGASGSGLAGGSGGGMSGGSGDSGSGGDWDGEERQEGGEEEGTGSHEVDRDTGDTRNETRSRYDLSFLDGVVPAAEDEPMTANAERLGYWPSNNSPIEDYGKAEFHDAIPGANLTDIIVNTIGRSPDNVGMDVMAGSDLVVLQQLLIEGIIGTGIGTDSQDNRAPETASNSDLRFIQGDQLDEATWLAMLHDQQELAPEGLAVALWRPVGAVQYQPPHVYQGAAHAILDMVRPGGMFFSQVPARFIGNRDASRQVLSSLVRRGDVARIITSDPFTLSEIPAMLDKRAIIVFKK